PSLWIEPQGDWGEGEVILVEIPSSSETIDNIVAFWQPARGLSGYQDYYFAYRMSWGAEPLSAPHSGLILETAAGKPAFGDEGSDERVFVIDFSDGDSIHDFSTETNVAQVNAFSSAGKITNVSASLVGASGNYRVYLKLDPGDADLAELRVAIEVGGRQWGETWLYRWTR
ncbi:MAG TPA: glucan biosynthesis protein D, partial [Gammaproteobacteria bacterium]|nr:glucan biosynthesis protein D [Gammaproteobacteria bacterium]